MGRALAPMSIFYYQDVSQFVCCLSKMPHIYQRYACTCTMTEGRSSRRQHGHISEGKAKRGVSTYEGIGGNQSSETARRRLFELIMLVANISGEL